MKNLLISQKLIVSFLIVAALAAIVGVVGIVSARSLATSGSLLNTRASIGIYTGDLLSSVYHQRGAVTAIGLYTATYNPDKAKSQQTSYSKYAAEADTYFKDIDLLVQTPETRKFVDAIAESKKEYTAHYSIFLSEIAAAEALPSDMEVGRGKGMESASEAAVENYKSAMDGYIDDITELSEYMQTATDEQNASMVGLSTTVMVILIVVLLIAVAVAIGIALYISNLISKPLQFMQRALSQVGTHGDLHFSDEDWATAAKFGEGKDETAQAVTAFGGTLQQFIYYSEQLNTVAANDLTHEIKILGDRDTIGNSLKVMLESLNEMFNEINGATEQVHTGAQQISDGSQALAQGATEQAASVQQLSSSINEVAGKTQENANLANHAADLSAAVRDNAQKGNAQMDAMMSAVKEISDASNEINQVIKVIDNIAFQTNILALNAAVEAARAGQHGKGFAVVAEEVRSLAAKSADAAKDTGVLIENSIEKATLGAKIANETSASLAEIVSGINESTEIVRQIADSSEEQSAAIKQINIGIDQVAQVVQQNSATAQESAATAEELSGQSNMLEELVGRFQLKGASQKTLHAPRPAAKKLPGKANANDDGGNFGKY